MTDSQIKALVSLLDDTDSEVWTHIQAQIQGLGEEALPHLSQAKTAVANRLAQERIQLLMHSIQFGKLSQELKFWRENESEDLLKGMYLVSKYIYPDLVFADLKEQVEQLYYEVWLHFQKELDTLEQLQRLSKILFFKLKFKGNVKNFHALDNSVLHRVIEKRTGNPISLCVLYMLLAERFDIPVFGVNLPNIFVLTYKKKDVQVYINPFNKGIFFTRKDIEKYLQQIKRKPQAPFFEPCDKPSIIQRVLRNLIVSYKQEAKEDAIADLRELLELVS